MRKTLLIAVAALCLVAAGFSLITGIVPAEEHPAAGEHPAGDVMCPQCNIVIPAGEKPVVEMLAGKKHTCSSCNNSYDEVAGKTTHTCTQCGGTVHVCPACGKTELVPKA